MQYSRWIAFVFIYLGILCDHWHSSATTNHIECVSFEWWLLCHELSIVGSLIFWMCIGGVFCFKLYYLHKMCKVNSTNLNSILMIANISMAVWSFDSLACDDNMRQFDNHVMRFYVFSSISWYNLGTGARWIGFKWFVSMWTRTDCPTDILSEEWIRDACKYEFKR